MPMMNVPPSEKNPGRWSLFARTLEDILGTLQHGETPLSRLDNLRERPGEELDPDDPRSPRELVHREKVGRLIRSLQVPGTFPLLSRDDLERIRRYFHIDPEESLQLQAAVIATQVQRMVYERFGSKDNLEQKLEAAAAALHAAQQLLPILTQAASQMAVVNMSAMVVADIAVMAPDDEESIAPDDEGGALADVVATAPADEERTATADREAFQGTVGSLVFRRGRRDSAKYLDIVPEEVTMLDRNEEQPSISAALAGALDAIDRGTLALSLSYSASDSAERLERARSARDTFADALEQLDRQDAEVKSSEAWQFWHGEARSGYQDADDLVADLGSR
jgi:hypothetical protein